MRDKTAFGERPWISRGKGEGGWPSLEMGEDAEEDGVGDRQQAAVFFGCVVEEVGAAAGTGVEVSEAFPVAAARGRFRQTALSPCPVGRRVSVGCVAEDDAGGAPFGEEAGGGDR